MSYELDAELAPAMAALAAKAAEAPARGDWQAVRAAVAVGQASMDTLTPASPGVTTVSFTAPASDGGGEIELRWYAKAGAAPGPAVVYAHGGGMIGGTLDLYDKIVSWYTAQTSVPFLSVGYRLAPEATSSTSTRASPTGAALAKAGVPIELHVHPGAPHGFERFVPDAGVAQRAMADRARAIAAI